MYCGANPKISHYTFAASTKYPNCCSVCCICSISLLNNVLRNESGASRFYLMLIQKSVNCPKLLTSRVRQICNDWNFNYILSCLSQEYIFNIKKVLLNNINYGQDGLVDSIRQLLYGNIVINDNNYRMLQLLLKSF